MAYRTDISNEARGGAIVAVVAIHAVLLSALLQMSGTVDLTDAESALQVFDFTQPKPPPPPPPPPPQAERKAKPKDTEGGSAPPNIKSEATPVKAPKPVVAPQKPNPVVVSETPRQGASATQGASPVAGPGTGAGGLGSGTGSGAGGNGSGGGGTGGAVVRTRLVTPPLSGRDFSQELLRMWPRGAPLFVRFRIGADGSILQCIVDRGTGVPAIDGNFCSIARARLRFRPGLDRQGRPVADWAAYGQQPPR